MSEEDIHMKEAGLANEGLPDPEAAPIDDPKKPCGNLIWFGQYEEINLKPE